MHASVNGVRLHYEDTGEASLIPIVLIHGFPFSGAMWAPQVESMRGKARIITYDIRGHGKSEAGDGQYTLELFVDDLLSLLDHLRIERAVFCGLSMGGYIALRAVEKTPGRVRGLILADTKSEGDDNAARLKRAASMQAVKRDGSRAFAESFVKAVFAPESFEMKPEAVVLIKDIISANSPLGICGALLALAGRTDTTASLPRIKVPTLVLVGEKDAVTPPAAAQSLRERIPGAELQVIPGAGHMSNLENPTEFNRHIGAYLSRL